MSVCAIILLLVAFCLIKLFSPSVGAHEINEIELGSVPCENFAFILSSAVVFCFLSSVVCLFKTEVYFKNKKPPFRMLLHLLLTTAMGIVLLLIFFIFLGIFNTVFGRPVLSLSRYGFFDFIILGVKLIPSLFLINSTEMLLFKLSKNKTIRLFLLSLISFSGFFLSGAFFPIRNFSPFLNSISEYQPFGLSVSYINRTLAEYLPGNIIPEICVCSALVIFLACVADKHKSEKQPSKRTVIVIVLLIIVLITLLGAVAMSTETAPVKLITVGEQYADNRIISNIENSNFVSVKRNSSLSGAKINLCYGNADIVYYFDHFGNTQIFARENSYLVQKANESLVFGNNQNGINGIIVSYFVITATIVLLLFLFQKHTLDYVINTVNNISIIRKQQ